MITTVNKCDLIAFNLSQIMLKAHNFNKHSTDDENCFSFMSQDKRRSSKRSIIICIFFIFSYNPL